MSSRWHKVKAGPIGGASIFVDTESSIFWHQQMADGKYDNFFYDYLVTLKLKLKVVWDVGAHIGYHTLAFAQMVGMCGKVIAFEPNPQNMSLLKNHLKKNIWLLPRVKLSPIALSDQIGTATFISSDSVETGKSSGSHLIQIDDELLPEINQIAYDNFEHIMVNTSTIDQLIQHKKYSVPNLIKIDVEGAEHLVVIGAQQTLKKYKPILFIEIHSVSSLFYIQNLLHQLSYNTNLIPKADITNSRCYISAIPS